MMQHLKPREFAELIEGELSEARAAHVQECASCRAQVAELRDTLRRTSAVEVPEPSPLFWEHFSSRVQSAIGGDASGQDASAGWLRRPAAAWMLSAAIATLVLAVVFGRALLPGVAPRSPERYTSPPHASARPVPETAAAHPAASPLEGNIEDDGAWALVRVVADDVAWEEAHAAGLGAAPGAAEGLALELTDMERAELARLVKTELKQNGV